jgi:predicted TPR repeat methyltransferase
MDLKQNIEITLDKTASDSDAQLHKLSMKLDVNKNQVYNKWANSYDNYVNKFEYNGPSELVRLLKMYRCHLETSRQFSVLDFGCGTGLLGDKFLNIFNKQSDVCNSINLVGIDISEKMLEKSNEREIYTKLSCLDITQEEDSKDVIDKLGAPNEGFDLVMSCGVFLEGHVSLAEIDRMLLKLVKKGGVLAFTVRQSFMEAEEQFILYLLQKNDITILAKAKINYLRDVEAWAIIIKRL